MAPNNDVSDAKWQSKAGEVGMTFMIMVNRH
ncbi:hypothetical protein COLO4_26475 [Corchorus olitorius]|uniref:Uncharacterized protein n=1 Tax=Corchorus olitorius TaxID=93759 RepID=A0A1R3HWT6_9ROSI|nr:hypothetical protein COLO4_26475 [Corchorus olitorius]